MGIKFYCPDGHKLNVKSFLAGKRGICPHCGAKFDVPLSGTSKDRPTAKRAEADRAGESGVSLGAELGLFEDDLAEWAQSESTAKADRPASSGRRASGGNGKASAVDPIAEAPAAVWYVRPPNGAQYGPAAGDIMRGWLDDGRVSADSLVWREGWPQWQSAAVVFPELERASPHAAEGKSTGPVILASDPLSTGSAGAGGKILAGRPKAHPATARRKTRQTALTITVGLGIVALVLVVIFIIIINRHQPAAESEARQARPYQPLLAMVVGEQVPSRQLLLAAPVCCR